MMEIKPDGSILDSIDYSLPKRDFKIKIRRPSDNMLDKSILGTSHKFTPEDFAVTEHPEYFMVAVADYLNVLRKRYAKYFKAKDEKKRRATLEKAILFLSYLNIDFKAGFMPEE